MSAVWTLIDLLAERRGPASLGDREWESVISVARAEVLAATLAEKLVDAELPPAVAALFADMRAAMRVQQTHALCEAEMARRALEPAGVRFVLLKGTAYAAAGLPNAAGRQIGDLDIMVARDDLDRAEAALLAAGWEWVKSDPYDDAYYRNHMHELPPLIHKERDRMIDVHHTILPLTHRARPDAAALLADAKPLPFRGGVGGGVCPTGAMLADIPHLNRSPGGEGLYTLEPADMVIHCAAHCMADGDLAGGLRNLWDFHILATHFSSDPGFWETMEARAERHQLLDPVQRAARLAAMLYGTAVPKSWDRWDRQDKWYCMQLTARDNWGRPSRQFIRLIFTIRSHWLRMPPLMLARHLWVKWRRG